MKLAVGLGNPGDRYVATRHNVGFRIVTALATASGITSFEPRYAGLFGCRSGSPSAFQSRVGSGPGLPASASRDDADLAVLLPHTFMNRSGEAVAAALAELPVGDLASHFVVVIDDLDLPFGRLRIRPSGGAGGHRGLRSLIDQLATRDFPRLRFGIGRPGPDVDPVEYVLAPFSQTEEDRLEERIQAAVAALETVFRDGVLEAMDRFNGSPEPDAPAGEQTGEFPES